MLLKHRSLGTRSTSPLSNNALQVPKNRVYSLKQRSARYHRLITAFHNNNQQSFSELKEGVSKEYNKALNEILPALEQARQEAKQAREPATEAEKRWQSAHLCLAEVQEEAHSMLDHVRDNSYDALGGPESITRNILLHHAYHRMQEFKSSLIADDLHLWHPFAPSINPLSWLPGAFLLTQVAACRVSQDDTPYLIACISIAMPPLNDSLRSLLLHWSLADNHHSGWMSHIPRGWHTYPSISQPCGSTAWETAFAVHAPILNSNNSFFSNTPFFSLGDQSADQQPLVSTPVYSIILQIPMKDSLEHHGGVKFVLKRTDGGQPEWIKPHNNADFFVNFSQPIRLFQAEKEAELLKLQKEREKEEERMQMAMTEEEYQRCIQASMDVDGLCEWGWARALVSSSSEEEEDEDGNGGGGGGGGNNTTSNTSTINDNNNQELLQQQKDDDELLVDWNDPSVLPRGWLSSVSSWQLLGDHPPPQPLSLSRKAKDLRMILEATLANANDNNDSDDSIATTVPSQQHDTTNTNTTNTNTINTNRKERLENLLVRCGEVDGTLQRYDAASLAARRAQHEKERLWEICKSAEDQATHLTTEITTALESARRTIVTLRGRSTEVTQHDMEKLAVQQAKDSTGGNGGMIWPFSAFGSGRQLAFVSQSVVSVGGVDATVLMQVYLEGDRAAVSAALAGATNNHSSSGGSDTGGSDDSSVTTPSPSSTTTNTNTTMKPAKVRRPAFDTVVISIAIAEPFPELHHDSRHGLSSEVMLHFGTVPHQYGEWSEPPQNWRAFPSLTTTMSSSDSSGGIDNGDGHSDMTVGDDSTTTNATTTHNHTTKNMSLNSKKKVLPWIQLQTYNIVDEHGSPVFVSPVLHGTVIRVPLQEAAGRVRGIEFVLKTKDDRWLNAVDGANFFVDLPIYA